jgi:hypothetical protein
MERSAGSNGLFTIAGAGCVSRVVHPDPALCCSDTASALAEGPRPPSAGVFCFVGETDRAISQNPQSWPET